MTNEQDSTLSTPEAATATAFPQLPCMVCGEVPEPAFASHPDNQPYKATAFTTHGHYGSTFFDDMDGAIIEVNICDVHLREHQDRVGYRAPIRPTYVVSPLLPFPSQYDSEAEPSSESSVAASSVDKPDLFGVGGLG